MTRELSFLRVFSIKKGSDIECVFDEHALAEQQTLFGSDRPCRPTCRVVECKEALYNTEWNN